jgi:hypothetical protein
MGGDFLFYPFSPMGEKVRMRGKTKIHPNPPLQRRELCRDPFLLFPPFVKGG